MQNDRDDKYEGSENSEYQFSDDHYEADAGATKHTGGYDGMVEKTGKSKRLFISIAVFVVLIGVVYKMVTPSSTTPSIEIAPPRAANTASQAPAQKQPSTVAAATSAQPVAPSAMPVSAQPTQMEPPIQLANPQQSGQPMPGQMPAAMPPQQPSVAAAPTATDMMQQAMSQGAPPQQIPVQTMPSPYAMPGVNPVQPATPPVTVVNGAAPDMQMLDNAGAAMAADSRRMEAEIQAEYSKRLSEYQSENKMLQVQLQTLSSQVGLLESKMNQLVSSLTQQYQGGGQQNTSGQFGGTPPAAASIPAPGAPPAAAEQSGPPPRIPYNVTAIIPGRAWLRSNTGDTLTVAEGDQIKGVGRVTKIDPYDGVIVVEMPSGKSVSLSYGNGS